MMITLTHHITFWQEAYDYDKPHMQRNGGMYKIKNKAPTICPFMDISIGERRHELLVAACLWVTVAFLRLWQSTLGGQVAGDVCWQVHLIWRRRTYFVNEPYSNCCSCCPWIHIFMEQMAQCFYLLTCVGDTVVLALPAHVINDNDPDERGSNHTAHHNDYHNAHSGPAILVVAHTSVTVWWRRNSQVDVATLRSQSIWHATGIFPSISRASIYYNKKLVGSSKEVALCENQRAVIFGPVESGSWAATSYTLEHSSFTVGHCSVFQWSQERWSFWKN